MRMCARHRMWTAASAAVVLAAVGLAQEQRPGQRPPGQQQGQAGQQQRPAGQQGQAGMQSGQQSGMGTGQPVTSSEQAQQARRQLDQAGASLADAIRVAEQHANGRAITAHAVTMSGAGGRGGEQSGQQFGFHVYCLNEQNRLMQVTINARNGEVLEAREVQRIEFGGSGQGMSGASGMSGGSAQIFKGNDVIGAEVKNAQDENLGNIRDLAVDGSSGRIAYAAVALDTTLGMGGNLHAVPWSTLQARDHDTFMLQVDREQLRAGGGFDENNWPRQADARLRSAGRTGDFVAAGFEEQGGAPTYSYKGSDLIGKPVKNQQGEDLGRINELAIDSQRGEVVFALVSFGGLMGLGDKQVPVPWSAFDQSQKDGFRLNIDKNRLQSAPTVDDNNWSKLTDNSFSNQIYTMFNVQPRQPGGQGQLQRGGPGTGGQGGATGDTDRAGQRQERDPRGTGNPDRTGGGTGR